MEAGPLATPAIAGAGLRLYDPGMDRRLPFFLDAGMWCAWFIYWIIAARFVRKTVSVERPLMRLTHLVPMGAGFMLVFHVPANGFFFYGPMHASIVLAWMGAGVTAAGLLFAVWARVYLGEYWSGMITLKEGHRVIRGGPYRVVRHPIYTGMLIGAIGSAMIFCTGDGLIGLVLIAGAMIWKLRREEKLLISVLGDEYLEFRRQVPALIPFLFLGRRTRKAHEND